MKKIIISFIFLLIGALGINAQTLDSVFQDNYSKVLKFNFGWLYDNIENKDSDNDGIWLTTYDTNRAIIHIDKNLNIVHSINTTDIGLFRLFKANNKLYSTISNCNEGTEHYLKSLDLVCQDTLGNILFTKRIKNEDDDTIKWQNMNAIMLDNTDMIFCLLNEIPNDYRSDKLRLIRVDTSGNVLENKVHNNIYEFTNIIPFNDQQFLMSKTTLLQTNSHVTYFVNNNTLEIEDSINGRYAYNMRKINDSIVAFNSIERREFNNGISTYDGFYTYLYLMDTRSKYSYSIEEISNPLLDSIFYGAGEENNRSKKINIDFINSDSIFSYFTISKKWDGIPDQMLGTGIINFNSQGSLNYFYQTPIDIGSMTLKATSDGGLIIPYTGNTGLYLFKFMPNGYNSILNLETKEKVNINVYPNPAKDYINVDFDANNFTKGEIQLFDMQGKLVKKAKLKTQKGNRVDISSLKAGNYSYNIILNGKAFGGMMIVVE
ncbi:MAG: secretion protein [Bacteroidetes bacterium]|nr:secretion protein [Bacteroidota bacterium]